MRFSFRPPRLPDEPLRHPFFAAPRAERGGRGYRPRHSASDPPVQIYSRGRTRAKWPGGRPARTRAQVEDRYERRPPGTYGARETPRDDERSPYGTRNYPPRGRSRQVDVLGQPRGRFSGPSTATRAQMQAIWPAPTVRGTAKRPAAPLARGRRGGPRAGQAAPVASHRRHPQLTGAAYAESPINPRPRRR